MTTEERISDHSERISRLEGINDELRNRLGGIENCMNVQLGLTVTMWITILIAIFIRGSGS